MKAFFRVYLEFIRIMPQLVLLFIVYFGSTRALGWNLSGEVASVIVFVLWGTAEMGDLVRGALISIPKHQYESSEALGLSKIQTYLYIIIPPDCAATDPIVYQPDHPYDQDYQSGTDDRRSGDVKSSAADH